MEETKSAKIISPLKAIRLKCIDCSNGQITEIKLCPIEDCPLYPFRFGKRPDIERPTIVNKYADILKTIGVSFEIGKGCVYNDEIVGGSYKEAYENLKKKGII